MGGIPDRAEGVMGDYIEREAALNCICSGCFEGNMKGNGFCGIPCDDYTQISKLPAADVRPVVRGEWIWTIDDDEYLGEYWKCNLCGEHSYIGYNFCPNCGADMRG